jgi:hypothetical protein
MGSRARINLNLHCDTDSDIIYIGEAVMTFFFNLENLEKESCDSSTKFIQILDTLYYKKLPSKRKQIKPIKLDMRGPSFILNLEPVLKLKKQIDPAYIVQYVKLCARRDFMLYKQHGIKSVQLSYYPDIDLDAIKTNPLIHITKSEIHLKHE